jgi:NADH-quinone oxidoreductase subunit L
MRDDKSIPRFFSLISLFTFFMLILVTSDNLVQLFFGWEGVGLTSYLLIGFWYEKPAANAAAIKAFLVNRIGDLGFVLGIFFIYNLSGSINFSDIFSSVESYADSKISFYGFEVYEITLACLLLFFGAMGKSAQLGLHTWLPDAMEGPTPVSALIHAATMVTAGVFMVARFSPVFEMSEVAAKKAVDAPTNATTIKATSDISKTGENLATIKTPAVTMVAAWIKADTGVGPSMASGSQVCNPNWADFPIAPKNKRRQAKVIS